MRIIERRGNHIVMVEYSSYPLVHRVLFFTVSRIPNNTIAAAEALSAGGMWKPARPILHDVGIFLAAEDEGIAYQGTARRNSFDGQAVITGAMSYQYGVIERFERQKEMQDTLLDTDIKRYTELLQEWNFLFQDTGSTNS